MSEHYVVRKMYYVPVSNEDSVRFGSDENIYFMSEQVHHLTVDHITRSTVI